MTIVILARNEEHTIAETIANVSGWCREVLVMNGCSTDDTASVGDGTINIWSRR